MERLFLKKGLPMKRYVVRRLLMAIPLLLAISFVCFCFINPVSYTHLTLPTIYSV